jgi:hypothetical protein
LYCVTWHREPADEPHVGERSMLAGNDTMRIAVIGAGGCRRIRKERRPLWLNSAACEVDLSLPVYPDQRTAARHW